LISKDLTEVKICDFGLARPIIAYEQPKKVDPLILDSLKEEGEHDKQEEKKQ
jgi:serine/threonine protein kinase